MVIPLPASVSCLFWLLSPPRTAGASLRTLYTLRPPDTREQEICDYLSFHLLFRSLTSSLHRTVTDSYPALQAFTRLQACGAHSAGCGMLGHRSCIALGKGIAPWKNPPCLFVLIIMRELFILFPNDKHTSLRS